MNERYRLVRPLASGGMAELFLGIARGAEGFEKPVAIKRVLPYLAKDEAVARMFLPEPGAAFTWPSKNASRPRSTTRRTRDGRPPSVTGLSGRWPGVRRRAADVCPSARGEPPEGPVHGHCSIGPAKCLRNRMSGPKTVRRDARCPPASRPKAKTPWS